MSSSSSSSSKGLNPSAASYEPQQSAINIAPAPYPYPEKIYLPHQFPELETTTQPYGAPPSPVPPLPNPQPQPPAPALPYPAYPYPPNMYLPHQFGAHPLPFPVLHPQPQLPPPPAPAVAYPPAWLAAHCYSPGWCWYLNGDQSSAGLINYGPDIQRVSATSSSSSSSKKKKMKKKGKCGFVHPRFKLPRDVYPDIDQNKKNKNKIIPNLHASAAPPDHSSANDHEKMKFLDGRTSLMIKNIPNHYRRRDLIGRLDDHCRSENKEGRGKSNFSKSAYDFLYLPMDFGFHLNLGFAFVNFTTPEAALRFYIAFDNLEWCCSDGRKKYCAIGVAKLQGRDALEGQFMRSGFPCHSNAYLPVLFSPPRDGSNDPRPTLVGRRTGAHATPKHENLMIMARRKIMKA